MAFRGVVADKEVDVEDTKRMPKKLNRRKPRRVSVVEGVGVETEGAEVVEGVAEEDVEEARQNQLLLRTNLLLRNPREKKRKLQANLRQLPRANLPSLSNPRQTNKLVNLSSRSRRQSQQL